MDVFRYSVRLIRGLLPYSIKKNRKYWEISSKSYIFETQIIKEIGACHGRIRFIGLKVVVEGIMGRNVTLVHK